ncbi:hypothetical protein EON65_32840 [archaeon]|nr:MAG: hypothetical protein EON65_32840 [archaeon]
MNSGIADISLWEKMVLEERRQRARELGLRVCDLEQAEALQSTIDESKLIAQQADTAIKPLEESSKVDDSNNNEREAEGDDMPVLDDYLDKLGIQLSNASLSLQSENKAPQPPAAHECGPWIWLPQELVDRILMLLGDADMSGYLCMASKTVFQPSEAVFKQLCMQIYLKQTVKKTLQIDRWRSWKSMLVHRPRLRTNGFYTLKTVYTKAYCNDAFWEEKQTQSIELRYFRHFRFFLNNTVLYSLDITESREMIKHFDGTAYSNNKRVYKGVYRMQRNVIHVEVPLPYCMMMFELTIGDTKECDEGGSGRHNLLTLTSHSSRSLTQTHPIVTYPLPILPYFRFYRVWRFRGEG